MDECKHHSEFVGEMKQFHLEIIDRLARIETKQDNWSAVNAACQTEIARLYEITTAQGKEMAALDREIRNIKWTAGIVAGTVASLLQILSFLLKRG